MKGAQRTVYKTLLALKAIPAQLKRRGIRSTKTIALFLLLCGTSTHVCAQAHTLIDTLKGKLKDSSIPRKTLRDRLLYPHRWYIKQLFRTKKTDFDTSYILNNKRKLTVTLPVIKKNFGFGIDDLLKRKALKFSPNTNYLVGVHLSNLIVTFGFTPGIKFGAKAGRGTTVNKDFQLTTIGKRVITDINLQSYRGFYVQNIADFSTDSAIRNIVIRPDIKAFSFGINTMFVHNYKKYSLRGAFSFSDVQLKSAGSFMTGLYHSYVIFSSDSGLVSQPFSPYFSSQLLDINKIAVITVGISEGYGYTFVYKRLILSTVLNLGVGGQKINYNTTDQHHHALGLSFSSHLNGRAALRYDNRLFFVGLMAIYDTNFAFNEKLFDSEASISKLMAFVGYRFKLKHDVRKLLKAMSLIDY